MDALKGRCLCGAIEVSLVPPLDFVSHCHCASCRRSHGAAFVTWTSVPTDRFTFVDPDAQLRWFASSQWIEWGFCGRCGSSMLYRAIADGHPESPKPDRMYVTAASLEGPLGRAPQAHVSYEERVDWLTHDDGVPKYRGKTTERCD